MEIILKTHKTIVKSIDEGNKTVTAIISHSAVDRDGDILLPEAFKKRLKSYKAHPVLLVNHSYKAEDHIGQAKSITLHDDHIEAKLEYFAGMTHANGDPMNPKADWAWEMAKKGLAAYSIGFKGFNYDWIKNKDDKGNDQITGRKFTDAELLETSHVVVPAQQNALQLMIDDENTSMEEKELCELVIKAVKEGKLAFPKVDPMKGEDPQQVAQNQRSQVEILTKRVSAVESAVSGAQSTILKVQGQVEDLEERLQALEQEPAPAGSPGAADANVDPQANAPAKAHYSAGKVVKDEKKTPQTETKTEPAKKRLKLDLASLKQTLTDTQKELKTL